MKTFLKLVLLFVLLVLATMVGSHAILQKFCFGQCSGDKACRELCFRQNHCPHGDN